LGSAQGIKDTKNIQNLTMAVSNVQPQRQAHTNKTAENASKMYKDGKVEFNSKCQIAFPVVWRDTIMNHS